MRKYKEVLRDVLGAAELHGFAGYSKFDALNSPFLKALSLNNKWLQLIFTQLVKEFPCNVRPLFRVQKSRNPKGIALFARAYLFLYEYTGTPEYLAKAESLLEWLLAHPSPGQPYACWGYNFIWQNVIFLQEKFEPNAVVSIFVGEAFLHAYRLTLKNTYLNTAASVGLFITDGLPVLHRSTDELAIAYVLRKVDAVVLNNQVLSGAFLVKVYKHTGQTVLLETAKKLINYTVNRRTSYYAWYYTHPRAKSPITHDNYHTGGILDGLLEFFLETGDDRYIEVYWKGLGYYEKHLFEPDGAPRWMNDSGYPFDIHGAAQGIISFSKAAMCDSIFLPQARKIADWTIAHLYRTKHHDFAYRLGRWYKSNYSLMRWCNAWMARALAECLLSGRRAEEPLRTNAVVK